MISEGTKVSLRRRQRFEVPTVSPVRGGESAAADQLTRQLTRIVTELTVTVRDGPPPSPLSSG